MTPMAYPSHYVPVLLQRCAITFTLTVRVTVSGPCSSVVMSLLERTLILTPLISMCYPTGQG